MGEKSHYTLSSHCQLSSAVPLCFLMYLSLRYFLIVFSYFLYFYYWCYSLLLLPAFISVCPFSPCPFLILKCVNHFSVHLRVPWKRYCFSVSTIMTLFIYYYYYHYFIYLFIYICYFLDLRKSYFYLKRNFICIVLPYSKGHRMNECTKFYIYKLCWMWLMT